MDNIKAKVFVGQVKKNDLGLSQKEQKSMIDEMHVHIYFGANLFQEGRRSACEGTLLINSKHIMILSLNWLHFLRLFSCQ